MKKTKYSFLMAILCLAGFSLSAQLPSGLVGHWKFEGSNPNADLTGNWGDLVLSGGASFQSGKLDVVNGSLIRTTSYSGPTISSKTLISFLNIDNLNLRSGSAITLDKTNIDNFDAIVYAEAEPFKWMSGSNSFSRTQSFSPGFAETTADEEVMIAITYEVIGSNIQITLYRNGIQYGTYSDGPVVTFDSTNAEILFGARHTAPGNTVRGGIDGQIDEAMIFDRALTAAEILSVFNHEEVDTALTLVSDNSWSLSTVVTTATANSYPWPGVMSTPATPTFTLPVDVNQPYPWEHLYTVAGSQVITAQSGVTYYRNTFDLVDPAGIEARFRMFVDDNMEIFINSQWIALEDDMGQYNWRTVNHDLVFNGDGTSTNGNAGGDAFDYVTAADLDTVFKAGTNEIVLAIRNRTSKPDLGGFSFRMDLDKGAVKKAGSVVHSTNNVATADCKLIIFPNPTSGNVTVALNHSNQSKVEGTVTVFDFSGKQIISQSIYSETELNLNSLPAGVYLVKVTSGVETFSQKVVKQ